MQVSCMKTFYLGRNRTMRDYTITTEIFTKIKKTYIMNILLDFIPFQYAGGIGGAASFTYRITEELLRNRGEHALFAMYDSQLSDGKLYSYEEIAMKNNIILIDRASNPHIHITLDNNHIDVWFIAIAQFYAEYELKNITCKTIMFIHDIFDIERNDTHIDLMTMFSNHISKKECFKRLFNVITGRWQRRSKKWYQNILPLYLSPKTVSYTVSNYTKESLKYYFKDLRKKDIRICYSPLKNVKLSPNIENQPLSKLIESSKPYIMMIAADREYKNANLLLNVFSKLKNDFPDLTLLTLHYGKVINSQHIDIPLLNDSDLEYAYMHTKALVFPSFFEGFCYPPIDALKYNTPTVASNVTSIPEILDDTGIYFSPFYPADLYRALRYVLGTYKKDVERKSVV